MRVGVAGLGRMGSAIAARLMEVGHEVTVWNRSGDKAKPLAAAGAKVAANPAELATQVEAIVTILTNRDAIAAVYEGPTGLLAGTIKGKLVIDMSTVQPETEVALAEKVRAKGAVFVECPVGGTVGPAREGKLLGVAGGTAEDFARAKPLLAQMCRRVEHVGPVGAGSSMKLALNLPLMVYYQALGESYVLCRHLGARSQMADGVPHRHLGRPQHPQGARRQDRRRARRRRCRPARLRRQLDPQGPRHHGGRGQDARREPAAGGANARRLR